MHIVVGMKVGRLAGGSVFLSVGAQHGDNQIVRRPFPGQGVADTIRAAMVRNGMTEAQAKNCFYFVDSKGPPVPSPHDSPPVVCFGSVAKCRFSCGGPALDEAPSISLATRP